MLEAFGNIWEMYANSQLVGHSNLSGGVRYDGIVLTTNGFVKRDGRLVMGRGIAKEALDMYPGIDAMLGALVKKYGNHVHRLMYVGFSPTMYSFPTKEHWRYRADINLIQRSAEELVDLLDNDIVFWKQMSPKHILMPRPGCGNGGLQWEDVKPVLETILDDRFTVVTNEY